MKPATSSHPSHIDHIFGMTNLPSDKEASDMLNTPERCLQEISDAQRIIKQQEYLITKLKQELTQHLEEGEIKKNFSYGGIKASYQTRISYKFSEEVTSLQGQLEDRKLYEKKNDIAEKKATKYWRVL